MMRGLYAAVILAAGMVVHGGASAAPPAQPGADQVLAALRRAHPATAFSAVRATPVAGLYEVRMGNNVAYVVGTNTRYLLFGHLFDTATMRDITPAQDGVAPQSADDAAAARVDVSSLPLADAIKEVKGTGQRALYVFTDARCGYCRQLHGELTKLDNVTIYYFMVPFLDHDAPVSVWCAPDRLAAWRSAMAGQEPVAAPRCAHPIDRNAALASKLRVRGTPTLIFADGSRFESAVSAEVIESRLSMATRSKQQ